MGGCQGSRQNDQDHLKGGDQARKSLSSPKKPSGRAVSQKRAKTPEIQLDRYLFPFENLVFGGWRGVASSALLAYCSAVRVLEESGLWPRIKRLCGSSTGAVVATLLSVGYSSQMIENFLKDDSTNFKPEAGLLVGGSISINSLVNYSSWNSGQPILTWLGDRLKEATGKADVTFSEVNQMYGKELCVVVVNLNQLSVEYCHPKTTPDMPIRIAVRMAISTPGCLKPVQYHWHGHKDIFVNGALCCHYPLHSFDGWWLSMDPDNSFSKQLPTVTSPAVKEKLASRFGTPNFRTLGIYLHSDTTKEDSLETILAGQPSDSGDNPLKLPVTTLSQSYQTLGAHRHYRYKELLVSIEKLQDGLRKYVQNTREKAIDSKVVENLAKDVGLTEHDLKAFATDKTSLDEIAVHLEHTKNDQVTYPELMGYEELRGLHLQVPYLGNKRIELRHVIDFVAAIRQASADDNVAFTYKEGDENRTVGINAHYIDDFDSNLEEGDTSFLKEIAEALTKNYLKNYVTRMSPPMKSQEAGSAVCRDDVPYFIDDDQVSEIIDERDYGENLIRVIT